MTPSRPGVRMVRLSPWLALMLSAVLTGAACGCGKNPSPRDSDAGLPPEAVAVRKAFESAPPSFRNPVSEMLALVKAGGANPVAYAEVIPQLESLAANPNLSADQKQALQTLAGRLRSEWSSARSR